MSTADNRPVDPTSGQRIGPLEQPGYYRGFSTLGQQKFWDAKTREVILDRVNNVPPIRFFNPEQARLLEAICNRLIPQDDRIASRRIPIVQRIDQRLFENTHDGYRYDDMPPDREAFTLGLHAIEEMARSLHRCSFADLNAAQQELLLQSLHDGKPAAPSAVWDKMPVTRFWMLLLQDCAEAYYAHPWAWDEIGYGGPAYPRAYMRLENGEPEPWELPEKRYAWAAPPNSCSGEFKPVGGATEHHGSPGQGGTH